MRKCYGTNEALMESLDTTKEVKQIMKYIDRGHFTDHIDRYCDKPVPLSNNQTISAPHMHAMALEYMYPNLKPGAIVLDVGSGSGYLTACMGYLVNVFTPNRKNRGKVTGIEVYKSLFNNSIRKTEANLGELFTYPSCYKFVHGSGWDGYPKKSKKEKYDVIHVGAAAEAIPIYLLHQLKVNGIMVLPLLVNKDKGHVLCVIKNDKKHNIRLELRESVRFVPLVHTMPDPVIEHGIKI